MRRNKEVNLEQYLKKQCWLYSRGETVPYGNTNNFRYVLRSILDFLANQVQTLGWEILFKINPDFTIKKLTDKLNNNLQYVIDTIKEYQKEEDNDVN